jgi:Ca2+-binding RTX toxin-like protein
MSSVRDIPEERMTTYRITTKKKALKGTAFNDSFFGSKFKDIFDGRAGDDYIYGADGSDSLTGGDGDDTIYSGAGSDKALGGLGKDTLYGSLGNDKLYGGEGMDYLSGDEDNDSLYGDTSRDNLYGGDGNDKLYGGEDDDYLSGDLGNDRLDGGKGNDQLNGGAGSDYLSGGAGDDILNGGEISSSTLTVPGKDRLLGGDGDDTLIVDAGDNALGGMGVETLNLQVDAGTSAYAIYSLNLSKVTGKKAADIGYQGIKAGQFEKVYVSVYDMDVGSLITGTKGSDTFSVYGKSGVINGGAGDDYLFASGYNADNPANGIVVNGDAGDDKLSGYDHVTLIGGKGDDQFILNQHAETTIADFSGKDYFLVRVDSFRYYDSTLEKYVSPTFDMNNPLVVGTDPKPAAALAQFLYDTDDGKLYFDADGTGLNFNLHLVTTLANKAALKTSDFVFVI